MTNQTIMPSATERVDPEQERRDRASAANHGGVHVLDADRPHVVGAPAITHQTTVDPDRGDPVLVDPAGIDAANRLALEPPLAQPAPGTAWGTLLLALLLIGAAIWLIAWLL